MKVPITVQTKMLFTQKNRPQSGLAAGSILPVILSEIREVTMKIGDRKNTVQNLIKTAGRNVKLSMCVMGLGQMLYGQVGKGLCYLAVLAMAVAYFVRRGIRDLIGLFTLGTQEADTWLGIEGDNSVVMLLMGILSVIAMLFLVYCYLSNIKDAYETQKLCERGGRPAGFREELKQFLDRKFYKTVLVLPIVGVCVFNSNFAHRF